MLSVQLMTRCENELKTHCIRSVIQMILLSMFCNFYNEHTHTEGERVVLWVPHSETHTDAGKSASRFDWWVCYPLTALNYSSHGTESRHEYVINLKIRFWYQWSEYMRASTHASNGNHLTLSREQQQLLPLYIPLRVDCQCRGNDRKIRLVAGERFPRTQSHWKLKSSRARVIGIAFQIFPSSMLVVENTLRV